VIKEIGRVIAMLGNQGRMAILLVEQYLDFARTLAHHFVVMERGSVVWMGEKDEVDDEAIRRRLAV
jgi:urea transport system ATP-binding protein